MRFAFFGYDFTIEVARRLLRDGHRLVGVFTLDCDNVFTFNHETLRLAAEQRVPLSSTPAVASDLDAMLEAGCELFLSAGYPFKIPPVDPAAAYAINIHPSLLPKGRGISPVPHILLDHPEVAGITVHKLTPRFDAGDVLHQEPMTVHPRETIESFSVRLAMRAPEILSQVVADLPRRWSEATPQDPSQASWFRQPGPEMRMLDWTSPVSRIDQVARAFGRYGSYAPVEDRILITFAHDVWEEEHRLQPGTVACRLAREWVVAASDGFVCLKDFQELPVEELQPSTASSS